MTYTYTMNTDIKIWILIGAASIMATILGFVMNFVTNQVIKKLDDIVAELKQLIKTTTMQGVQINNLSDDHNNINAQLLKQADRIREIEINMLK